MNESPFYENPFVGPRPFELIDSQRFFGRDQEARELLPLIIANRITVMYAQSGAGKTSLLNALIVPRLEQEKGIEVFPLARVQGPSVPEIPPEQIPNIYVFHILMSLAGDDANAQEIAHLTLAKFLAAQEHFADKYDLPAPRVLIFDQFEELFTAYPEHWDKRADFFEQLNEALEADPLLRLVLTMREDYIAQLDSYEPLLSASLRTRFRLERMRPDAALVAINGPLTETNRQFDPEAADQLVIDLRKVQVKIAPNETITVTGEFIEPVQLQVVCQTLWQELPDDIKIITKADVKTYGDINEILSQFYERALAQAIDKTDVKVMETALRQWFSRELITPADTRGTVYQGQAKTGDVPNEVIEELVNRHIIRGEWRAGARWYELTHDRLIEPIKQANQTWQENRRARRIRQVATAIGIIITLFGISFLIAVLSRQNSSVETTRLIIASTAQALVAATVDFQLTEEAGIRATADFQLTEEAGARATTNIQATATANTQATINIYATVTAVAHATNNAQLTATNIARMTADAQAQATGTAIAQTAIDAQATITAQELERFSQPFRPIRPGISISGSKTRSDTLGAIVRDNGGNIHLVLPSPFVGAAADPSSLVLQPSEVDGGVAPENLVASFSASNSLFSLARLEAGIGFETGIQGVGPVRGVRPPVLGSTVHFLGRTSGLVTGTITEVGRSFDVPKGFGGRMIISNQFIISPVAKSGDSGALIVDDEGYGVGLVLTGMESGTIATPLQDILEEFDVELVHFGTELYTLTGHENWVFMAKFNQEGTAIVSASADQTVRVWDITDLVSNIAVNTYTGHLGDVNAAAFSPDGEALASGSDDRFIFLWDALDPNKTPFALVGHHDLIWSLAFSPDGQTLASGSADRDIRLWLLKGAVGTRISPTGFLILEVQTTILAGHRLAVTSVAFSPDGQMLASASFDGTIRLWNLTNPSIEPITLEGHKTGTRFVAFSPDGTILASADAGGFIYLWDLTNLDAEPDILSGHEDWVNSLAFSPDGQTLASASGDHTIRLWNLNNLKTEPIVLTEHTAWVRSVDFSSDGRWLATASDDRTIRIWQVK